MPRSNVRATLEQIGAIQSSRVIQFAGKTRDRDVLVYRDPITEVIFIDDFYVGDSEYESGTYRGWRGERTYEDAIDTERRVAQFQSLCFGRSILDFGCGEGNFLRSMVGTATALCGVELQDSYRDALNRDGIECVKSLSLGPEQVDVTFMFHVLEHLPDPLPVLNSLREVTTRSTGVLVVEVPHARDFLLSEVRCKPFIEFTLWSQHLILHTRDSLAKLLKFSGFSEINIYGVQRYGLANHLTWLSQGKPGGHRGPLSHLETRELSEAYQAALAAQDSTDTLVAIAR